VDPGFGRPRPPVDPIYGIPLPPNKPENPIALPPDQIWPPLEPGIGEPGGQWVYVSIPGVGGRWVYIDFGEPTKPTPKG
jgi:hypothetical protein